MTEPLSVRRTPRGLDIARAASIAAAALLVMSVLAPSRVAWAADPIKPSDAAVVATMAGTRLTLTSSGAPWSTVVDEVARRTGIALRVTPLPAGTVTASIAGVEIERALRLLFGADASFVFVYGAPAEPTSAPPLDQVWVQLPGDGRAPLADPLGRRSAAAQPGPPAPLGVARDVVVMESDDDGAAAPTPTLEDRAPLVRQQALDAIVDRGDGSGVEEIRQVLLGDRDHEVRARAVTALRRVATREALEALRPGLADPEPTVRLTIVDALATFETPRARALLREALRDEDEQVRSVAAAILTPPNPGPSGEAAPAEPEGVHGPAPKGGHKP